MSLAQARSFVTQNNQAGAERTYGQIIQTTKDGEEQEQALMELGKLYRDHDKFADLAHLINTSRDILGGLTKTKAAKVIRNLIELFSTTNKAEALPVQIETIERCIEWSIKESRAFLRQNLQTKLIAARIEQKNYQSALSLAGALLSELKRMDDKLMLVEVQLLEARIYYALRNLPKARASLTSARTSANSVYTPPLVQANLDLMSGILQAEEKNYKTAYSYFFESFEEYAGQDDPKAGTVLKYMMLSKTMLNLKDDMTSLLQNKAVQKYKGRSLDAMRVVFDAHLNRSLRDFELALRDYPELSQDLFLRSHFSDLYDNLLEQNLAKVVEPFSCVEISHVASLIGLSTSQVEGKLSQMILDKVFHGVLDQGSGCLYVYDAPELDATYDAALETVKNMSATVDLLYDKASALN